MLLDTLSTTKTLLWQGPSFSKVYHHNCMPQEGGAITIRVALAKFMTTSSGSKTRGQHVALDEIRIFFNDNLLPKTWCCASQIPAGKIHLCELTTCALTPTMGITNIHLCPACISSRDTYNEKNSTHYTSTSVHYKNQKDTHEVKHTSYPSTYQSSTVLRSTNTLKKCINVKHVYQLQINSKKQQKDIKYLHKSTKM